MVLLQLPAPAGLPRSLSCVHQPECLYCCSQSSTNEAQAARALLRDRNLSVLGQMLHFDKMSEGKDILTHFTWSPIHWSTNVIDCKVNIWMRKLKTSFFQIPFFIGICGTYKLAMGMPAFFPGQWTLLPKSLFKSQTVPRTGACITITGHLRICIRKPKENKKLRQECR